MDKQQPTDGTDHHEYCVETWSIPCGSRKRDGNSGKPRQAFLVDEEHDRDSEDRGDGT